MLPKFRNVASAKLLPAIRIVPEPFPKVGARRKLLHPALDRRILLLDPTWPQPIDQNARAVIVSDRFIGALQLYALCRNPFAYLFLLENAFHPAGKQRLDSSITAQTSLRRTSDCRTGTSSLSNQGLRFSHAELRHDGCGNGNLAGVPGRARILRQSLTISVTELRCRLK